MQTNTVEKPQLAHETSSCRNSSISYIYNKNQCHISDCSHSLGLHLFSRLCFYEFKKNWNAVIRSQYAHCTPIHTQRHHFLWFFLHTCCVHFIHFLFYLPFLYFVLFYFFYFCGVRIVFYLNVPYQSIWFTYAQVVGTQFAHKDWFNYALKCTAVFYFL